MLNFRIGFHNGSPNQKLLTSILASCNITESIRYPLLCFYSIYPGDYTEYKFCAQKLITQAISKNILQQLTSLKWLTVAIPSLETSDRLARD